MEEPKEQLLDLLGIHPNADCVPEEDRFKLVDDLSTLEIINLLSISLTTFDLRNQVPNDI